MSAIWAAIPPNARIDFSTTAAAFPPADSVGPLRVVGYDRLYIIHFAHY